MALGALPAASGAQAVASVASEAVSSADSTHRAPLQSRIRIALTDIGGLAIATAATMPFDRALARTARAPSLQRSGMLREGVNAANAAGDPGVLALSAAMFGVGKLVRQPAIADFGLHTGEAIVLSGLATAGIKLLAGRQRPYVEAGDSDDFQFAGGGDGKRASFPSGHTTAAFAFASVAAAEIQRHRPEVGRIVTPALYLGATAVGLARMYDDKHWASDVVLGAGIGTLVGRQVMAFAHSRHPSVARGPGWVTRHLGGLAVAPHDGGWMVMVELRAAQE